MTGVTRCHSCESELSRERFSRRDVCASFGVETRACRNCRFFDESAAHQCTEPIAEPVREKERANFCEYFSVAGGEEAATEAHGDARSALEDLFRKS